MVKHRALRQMLSVSVLLFVALTASACYKDAGENVQPTSNRVDLQDLQPTTPPPSPTPTDVIPPDSLITPSITLKPTITPAELQPTQPVALPTATPSSTAHQPAGLATPTPLITSQPAGLAITTPGMSDAQPSPTPMPTLDPTYQPTPTPLPPEANPCLYIIQPNDTLYSIAREKEVTLADLIAANTAVLPSGEYTILQLGMQLTIPGCVFGPAATPGTGTTVPATPGVQPQPTTPGGIPTQHIVQAGETIFSIGRKYNVDPNQIIALNNLANPNLIKPGDVLLLPQPQ